ncbi:hypothetical protein RND71_026810 [Anisodus tanguticus]|uniref:Myb-like domain-containing protein n=1 Tax=Anisodus tanguticus TaxID=243964 RepID=A0AAE1RMZ2_9SOLA|nr:hypothetical protein RND71_026810 [Anisodus tanguticus]
MLAGVSSGLITSTTTTTTTTGDGAFIPAAPPPQPSPPPPPQEANPESGGSSEGGGGGDVTVSGDKTRKLADLGYHRSGKKCKEKFENVYKYHRRTKEGRASKADGKTYRFFDQLQALENNPASHSLPPPPLAATPLTMAMPVRSGNLPPVPMSSQNYSFVISQNNVVTAAAQAVSHTMTTPALPLSQPQPQPQPTPAVQPITNLNQINRPQVNTNTASFLSNSTSSSSTSSDEDIQRQHTKKRKWKDFFERLMKDMIEKQEELQKKFLETLDKRERDRMAREETWRVQEMARLNREHDLLVQERSMAAAKDATIIAFLQKITEQQNTPIPNTTNNTSPAQIQLKLPENPLATPHKQTEPPAPPAIPVSLPMTIHAPVPPTPQALSLPVVAKSFETPKNDSGGENFSPASSSRWPKEEIEALISLRTCLDLKYQENGPKGPLWEEISAGMGKLGYNRNAKRCKEKWENINKYFKKVKESNKKRPEDSKTCPYFHQLEALYKEKAKNDVVVTNTAVFGLGPENNTPIAPIMAQPEQQWPRPNNGSDSMDEDDDDMDEDDEDEGDGYQIVTNKQQPSLMTTVAAATTAAV